MCSVLVNLPQLTSGNFNNWKFRVRTMLEEKQIKIALEKAETDFEHEKEKLEFKIKDTKAKSTIVQCLTDKHLDLVKDAQTAKQMMQALEDIFERKSVFTKLTLKKKLLLLKLKRNEKLEDHFLNFDTIIRELENAGSKMEEEDKVCHLLLTLNEEYDAVITAIVTLSQKITMDFVKSRLLDEELKIKTKSDKNSKGMSSEESVFQVSHIVCYKCGKQGHKMSECDKNTDRGRGWNRGRGRGRRFVSGES